MRAVLVVALALAVGGCSPLIILIAEGVATRDPPAHPRPETQGETVIVVPSR